MCEVSERGGCVDVRDPDTGTTEGSESEVSTHHFLKPSKNPNWLAQASSRAPMTSIEIPDEIVFWACSIGVGSGSKMVLTRPKHIPIRTSHMMIEETVLSGDADGA